MRIIMIYLLAIRIGTYMTKRVLFENSDFVRRTGHKEEKINNRNSKRDVLSHNQSYIYLH